MPRDEDQNLPVFSPGPDIDEDVGEVEFVAEPARPRTGIDFESDEPLIEQLLKQERLDRSDKTLEGKGCLARAALLISLAVFLSVTAGLLIWGWLCL